MLEGQQHKLREQMKVLSVTIVNLENKIGSGAKSRLKKAQSEAQYTELQDYYDRLGNQNQLKEREHHNATEVVQSHEAHI